MDIFGILEFIGGLAMFLFGMQVMSDGLSRVGGSRLERVLERATSNKFKSVALGAGVTAVIQSSSATTVMVVGFVNSGMMKLRQAIGLIMGANIGTTMTAWILSLSGIESENLFIRMLKPSSFAPILAIIGVAMMLFAKRESKKDIGSILIGFAVLMFGMDVMSGAMKPLANSPAFMNLMTMFSNPLLGVLFGAVITAVIQSSSASVGILQALALTGAVDFSMAIPIIMGQNIGTCVTALLSCIGANKNAKRAAMVHLYFNVIGVVLFLGLFYAGNAIFSFPFMNSVMDPAAIAVVHTAFNLLTTSVLLPFSGVLEKLATATIRGGDGKKEKKSRHPMLDERFLSSPAFALEQCRNLANDMGALSHDTFVEALELIRGFDREKAEKIKKNEARIDEYEDILDHYMSKLAGKEFSERDSQEMSLLLHMVGDFERIGDHAVSICERMEDMRKREEGFSEACMAELDVFLRAAKDVADRTFEAYRLRDKELAADIEPVEEVVDRLTDELKNRHIRRVRSGECTVETGFLYTDVVGYVERASDHCSNIAINIIGADTESSLDTHKLRRTKAASNEFLWRVDKLMEEYALPAGR